MKLKKKILLLSYTPYIFLIFKFLSVGIFGYGYNLGKTAYHFLAISNWVGDYGDKLFLFDLNIYNFTFGVCILYQIAYIIMSRNHSEDKSNKKKEKTDISRIIFIITIFFWISLFLYAIYSMIFGIEEVMVFCVLDCYHSVVYGLRALKEIIVLISLFSIIPIIPIILFFDILYITIRKKKGLNLIMKFK